LEDELSSDDLEARVKELELSVANLQSAVATLVSRDLASLQVAMSAVSGNQEDAKQYLSELRETGKELYQLIGREYS
jgi:hypothetical protein